MNLRIQEMNYLLAEIEFSMRGYLFYTTDGNRIFEVRGPSGGVTSSLVAYIVKEDHGKWFRYGIPFSILDAQDPLGRRIQIRERIFEALAEFMKNPEAVGPAKGEFKEYDDLGLPERPILRK